MVSPLSVICTPVLLWDRAEEGFSRSPEPQKGPDNLLNCVWLLLLVPSASAWTSFPTNYPCPSTPPSFQHTLCPEPHCPCSTGSPTHAHDPDLSLPGFIKCWVFIGSASEMPRVFGPQVHPQRFSWLCLPSAVSVSPTFPRPYPGCP